MTIRSWVAVLIFSISLAACGGDAAKHGTGQGTVSSVDAAKGEITLDHGDIPGVMMAMTMTFPVSDKKILEGVAPGAKVEFDVDASGAQPRVTAIRVR
jgi:Cu(I)/Ag(I) efflux system periplasmic protein CusF